MAGPGTGSSSNGRLPVWAQILALIGVPGAIAFWLLGMVPGTTPPLGEMRRDIAELRDLHRETQHLLRLTCQGVWAHYREEITAEVCWHVDGGPNVPRRARPRALDRFDRDQFPVPPTAGPPKETP